VTPLLVTTNQPKPWTLFGFLIIVWLGSAAAARMRHWRVAPAIANAGLGLWALAYLFGAEPALAMPPSIALVVMLAGLAFFWPGRVRTSEPGEDAALRLAWGKALLPPHLASTLTAALGVMFTGMLLAAPDNGVDSSAPWAFACLALALALLGALRAHAAYPLILSALLAIIGVRIMTLGSALTGLTGASPGSFTPAFDPTVVMTLAFGLGLAFVALSLWVNIRSADRNAPHPILWTVTALVAPLALGSLSFIYFGDYVFDLRHGLYGLVLAGLYLFGGIFAFRGDDLDGHYRINRDLWLASSWAGFVFGLVALTHGVVTTLGVATLGFVYLLSGRLKPWPILPWAMAVSALFVAGRIAWQPTIVGAAHLGTTPVFNALLIGYGGPALLLIASAWLVRKSTELRLRSVMEALASLFCLLTVAMLVRHAMNGGVLDSSTPTLAEQAIYTLLAIGASTTLMALDLRQPSIVFRTGSMAVGYLSMLSVLAAHYGGLNPYFTGESTGSIPVFNLLLLGYLLPGLAYAGASLYARSRRLLHYVIALALTGASLLFAYVTLSVRRLYHGADISAWKGFQQAELYTYSAVWLALAVALLLIGYRFRARSLRMAAAFLMLIVVLKVFLVDMSNLEGLYRVVSFIGLGVALIGIGRFYQTILGGLSGPPAAAPGDGKE